MKDYTIPEPRDRNVGDEVHIKKMPYFNLVSYCGEIVSKGKMPGGGGEYYMVSLEGPIRSMVPIYDYEIDEQCTKYIKQKYVDEEL